MQTKVVLIGCEESEGSLLAEGLQQDGYRVESFYEPEFCAVYAGRECNLPEACSDFLILDQHLPQMEALEHLQRYKQKCPGSISRVALLATILSPDELVGALELGCKVLFKPVKTEEVESWIQEVLSEDRRSMLRISQH